MEATQMDHLHEDIVKTIREPLLILDQDLKVILASRSFYEFFKVTPEETMGQLVYDLGNKQWDIPKLRELLETILSQKTSFDNYEVEHDFTDIGKRIMLLNARQVQRVWGKERIILLAIENITERRQLEMLLADSEKRYRRLFETANDGILLLEKNEGNIAQTNPAIRSILGYSNREFFGKKLKDVGFPDNVGTIRELLQALEQNGIIHYNDTPINKKTGEVLYTDIYMVDKADLIQCNIRDATKHRKLEAQLNQAQKMESVGRLAGGVAHDFNNMLGVILGHAEFALEKAAEHHDLYADLKQIQKAARRSAALTKQLLTFARKDHLSLP